MSFFIALLSSFFPSLLVFSFPFLSSLFLSLFVLVLHPCHPEANPQETDPHPSPMPYLSPKLPHRLLHHPTRHDLDSSVNPDLSQPNDPTIDFHDPLPLRLDLDF